MAQLAKLQVLIRASNLLLPSTTRGSAEWMRTPRATEAVFSGGTHLGAHGLNDPAAIAAALNADHARACLQRIAPAQAVADHEDHSADHPAIIEPRHAI